MNTAQSRSFSARLRKARILRGWSQMALSERAEVPDTSICRFESGERVPSFENFKRLARTLDVSADYLLGRVDTPDGQPETAFQSCFNRLSRDQRNTLQVIAETLVQRNCANSDSD